MCYGVRELIRNSTLGKRVRAVLDDMFSPRRQDCSAFGKFWCMIVIPNIQFTTIFLQLCLKCVAI